MRLKESFLFLFQNRQPWQALVAGDMSRTMAARVLHIVAHCAEAVTVQLRSFFLIFTICAIEEGHICRDI